MPAENVLHAAAAPAAAPLELSIVMPCLNEAETLATCVRKALHFLETSGTLGEVIVADNGSTDGSQEIARRSGARVVDVPARGYGAAILGGIESARGRFVVMGDADDSYDFENLQPFVDRLRAGADLVMGNRFSGGISPGAMPAHHRYFGNPVLSGVGRLLYPSEIRDFHCGLRAFSREAIRGLGLSAPGMEFASEMIVKASIHGLRIAEVPTPLAPDGRSRKPHLRSWHDGWRHLKLLLLLSPRWLFFVPGFFLLIAGGLATAILVHGNVEIGHVGFNENSLLYSGISMQCGLQTLVFGVFSTIYAVRAGILPKSKVADLVLRRVSVERGLQIGALLFLGGIAGTIFALHSWSAESFGRMNPSDIARMTVPSAIALCAGMEIFFASFFLGLLAHDRPAGSR